MLSTTYLVVPPAAYSTGFYGNDFVKAVLTESVEPVKEAYRQGIWVVIRHRFAWK